MNPYFTTPNIIKETANGTTYCPIQDEMFSVRRCVEVVGEITRDSVYSLILQLRYLCHAGQEKEITMYINSPGGSVCDGLALYDVMKGLLARTLTLLAKKMAKQDKGVLLTSFGQHS